MSEQKEMSLRPVSMADSESTVAHSKEPSFLEKKEPAESVMPSTAPSMREPSAEPSALEEKEAKVQPDDKAAEQKSTASASDDDDDDDDFEYPKAWRLAVITLALCLSVFCMALVRRSLVVSVSHTDNSQAWISNY